MRLTENDGHGFRPPCYGHLYSFKGPLFHQMHNLPHPAAIFNHAWQELLKNFQNTLDDLADLQKSNLLSIDEAKANLLIDSYRRVLYSAAEFISDIEDNISKCFSENGKRVDISGSTSARKLIMIPCNKLKHNHNRIFYFEANNKMFRVSGYAIFHVKNGVLRPNVEIHPGERGNSFNVGLRRILAACYLYAEGVGINIQRNHPNIVFYPVPLDDLTNNVILRVANLPYFAMPFETPNLMPKIDFDGKVLNIEKSGGPIMPLPTNAPMSALFRGDGHTNSFRVP